MARAERSFRCTVEEMNLWWWRKTSSNERKNAWKSKTTDDEGEQQSLTDIETVVMEGIHGVRVEAMAG